MFKKLDSILHQPLRLSIVSLLVSVESADFAYLRENTHAKSNGNLSIQIKNLKEAGYIEVEKTFRDNYPLTTCSITPLGIEKFEEYVDAISGYLNR